MGRGKYRMGRRPSPRVVTVTEAPKMRAPPRGAVFKEWFVGKGNDGSVGARVEEGLRGDTGAMGETEAKVGAAVHILDT